MNIGENETVFSMDMGDDEVQDTDTREHGCVQRVEQDAHRSKTTDKEDEAKDQGAALTYEKDNMGHMTQYKGKNHW